VADAKTNPDGVSKSTIYPSEMGELISEQTGEQSLGGGESVARHLGINNPNGRDCPADERSLREDVTRGEQDEEITKPRVSRLNVHHNG
jgi:hypothetical protein